jgi:hypothetical protein
VPAAGPQVGHQPQRQRDAPPDVVATRMLTVPLPSAFARAHDSFALAGQTVTFSFPVARTAPSRSPDGP